MEYEVRVQTTERVSPSGQIISRVPAITMVAVQSIYEHMKDTYKCERATERFMRIDISPQRNYRMMSMAPRLRVKIKSSDLELFYKTKKIPAYAWNNREIKLTLHRGELNGPLNRTVSAEIGLDKTSVKPGGSADLQIRSICQFYEHKRHENTQFIRTDLRILKDLPIDSIGLRSSGRLGVVGRPGLAVSSRYIQRKSLYPKDKRDAVRMDISYVRRTADGSVPRAADHSPLSSIEIEVERTGGEKASRGWWEPLENAANQALEAILLVRKPYQTREASALALADFERFIKRTPFAGKVLKPRPVTKNSELCGVNRLTDKADGVTAHLLVTPDGSPYVITNDGLSPNGRVIRTADLERMYDPGTETAVPKDIASTLLIGELVVPPTSGSRPAKPVFLVFDALIVGNLEQTSLRLDDRLAAAQRVVSYFAGGTSHTSRPPQKEISRIASEGKEPMPHINSYDGDYQWWPFLWMKKFDVVPDVTADWERGDLPYHTDGIILMSDAPIHCVGRTPPVVVKWKPRKQQTVDLLVYRDRTKGVLLLYMDRFGVAPSTRYMFAPVSPSIATFDEGSLAAIEDGVIAEFLVMRGIDSTEPGVLTFVKIRADKTARYQKGMQQAQRAMCRETGGQMNMRRMVVDRHEKDHFDGRRIPDEWAGTCRNGKWEFPGVANNRKVLLQTLEIAQLRVLTDDGADRDRKRQFINKHVSYFDKRRKKTWLGRRQADCNNLAKELLMGFALAKSSTYAPPKNVLDLCCGEGNDLNRWNRLCSRIGEFVGIDRDLCNAVEAERRLDLSSKKKLRAKAKCHRGDMETLAELRTLVPFGGFDVITVFMAIHYSQRYIRKFLDELAKWSAPGGLLIMTYMDSDLIAANMKGGDVFAGTNGENFEVRKGPDDDSWDVTIGGIGKMINEPKFNLGVLQSGIGASASAGGAPMTPPRWTSNRFGRLIDLRRDSPLVTTPASSKIAKDYVRFYEGDVAENLVGVSGSFRDTAEGKFAACYKYAIYNRSELLSVVGDLNLESEVTFSKTQRKHLPLLSKALQYAERALGDEVPSGVVVFEPFASVGTDTIALALRYKTVLSIEYDGKKFGALKQNVRNAGFDNSQVVVHNANTVDVLADEREFSAAFGDDKSPRIAYVDAPWGGPDYFKKKSVRIELPGSDAEHKSLGWIVANMPKTISAVVLKLPPNFDATTFMLDCPTFVLHACKVVGGHFRPDVELCLTRRLLTRQVKGVIFVVLHRRKPAA